VRVAQQALAHWPWFANRYSTKQAVAKHCVARRVHPQKQIWQA
jgi:hypothetical protein